MCKRNDLQFALEQFNKQLSQLETLLISPIYDALDSYSEAQAIAINETLQLVNDRIEKIFLSLVDSLKNQNNLLCSQLLETLDPLLLSIGSIRITPEHVEIPATLIPDNFDRDEELNSAPHQDSVVKLPSEKALSLIGMLISILIYIASYIQSQSPTTWQEQYHQEEIDLQRKQYDAITEEVEYLKAIYDQLSARSEDYTEYPTSDDRPNSQPTESYPAPAESPHSTNSDLPGESEPQSEPD
ncbi:hypothetical protein [Brotaphodocola sp.]|uniref:hypothetical protein n=1 Tax=Brotaphodocola sp. TaxID=3073577 RepID=UPI003D7E4159